jgi:hypothetical protein
MLCDRYRAMSLARESAALLADAHAALDRRATLLDDPTAAAVAACEAEALAAESEAAHWLAGGDTVRAAECQAEARAARRRAVALARVEVAHA